MKRRLAVLLFLICASVAAGTVYAADLKGIYADAQRDFKRGEYERAAAEWTHVIAPDPADTGANEIDLASAYYNRGMTYKKLLKWKEAADDFSMVVGLNPNDAQAFYQRAGCYEMLGLSEKANADVLKACELSDDYCTEKMLEQKKGKDEIHWGTH